MNLFELNTQIRHAANLLEEYALENEGDITNFPLNELMDKYEGDRAAKILDLACWQVELEADAEAIKRQADIQVKRAKVAKNKAQRIKDYINSVLNPDEKLKDPRVTISWRKSESVDIDNEVLDIDSLDEQYKKIKVEPNKTELKKALKSGIEIAGVDIVTNHNLQIK